MKITVNEGPDFESPGTNLEVQFPEGREWYVRLTCLLLP